MYIIYRPFIELHWVKKEGSINDINAKMNIFPTNYRKIYSCIEFQYQGHIIEWNFYGKVLITLLQISAISYKLCYHTNKRETCMAGSLYFTLQINLGLLALDRASERFMQELFNAFIKATLYNKSIANQSIW